MSSSPNDSDPAETITRILFLSPHVHIYAVPPLSSNKGYTTTSWTPLASPPTPQTPKPEPITTRLRVVESSTTPPPLPPSDPPLSSASSTTPNGSSQEDQGNEERQPHITTTILLEEKSTGDLFAACPYTSPSAVLPVTDSTRFFALRVEGQGGRMKAVLGVGFEERTEAMDFGICLQGVRRVLGMDDGGAGGGGLRSKGKGDGVDGGAGGGGGGGGGMKKKDWGLKDGEMIRVEIGGKGAGLGGNHVERKKVEGADGGGGAAAALFSIKSPPSHSGQQVGSGGLPFLPPPPSAREVKEERRKSRGDGVAPEKGSAADLGFDDGEFGEFQ